MIAIKKRVIIGISVVLVLCVALSISTERTYTKTEYRLFDTICTITASTRNGNLSKYINILHKIDGELDIYDTKSPIYKLNHGEWAEFSKSTYDHIQTAFDYSDDLDDYFSIYLNPVYEIWNDAINNKYIPDFEQLKEASKAPQNISFLEPHTPPILGKKHKYMRSDTSMTFGATAKGYATKAVLDEVVKDNVKSALINLGGNIYAHGRKPDGSKWTVGIADPKNPATSAVTLQAEDVAVITSGDYERYFEKDGKRYHHIIDPKTLMPAESGIHSATAIGKDPELCDIMSTALFVAGTAKAKQLCEEYDIDTIIISDDTIYYTEGAYPLITEYDAKYKLTEL